MLGEILLRRKARAKKATVPLLDDGGDVVMGSLAIAKHAEKSQGGAALFPPGKEAEIDHWADVAERITDAGRGRALSRMLQSKQALVESTPSFVPGVARGLLAPGTGMAVRFLVHKYGVDPAAAAAQAERTIRPLLEETREAIKEGGYVLSKDCFTFADIALASALQALAPRRESPFGPAVRDVWTSEELAEEFDDLLAWRDTVYAKHRSS